MAAGLGFKDFQTGEVLTAADVDGYLMQGIWVFTNTTARDAAVTSPQEGNFAFTKDTNSLWYYDGAAWVASGATGDIEGVTAGIGISGGGTSGTVTVTNSMATAIDAKGDLVAGTGADTFAKLTVGANNTVLTADSAEATGLKWATPAGGGGMTSLASGSLSGSSLDLQSISSSYNNLQIVFRNVQISTNAEMSFRLNNISSSDYDLLHTFADTTQSILTTTFNSTAFRTTYNQIKSSVTTSLLINIWDYTNTSSHKQVQYQYQGQNNVPRLEYNTTIGACKTTSAIDRFTLNLSSGTFTAGTYILYGVK